eukprot:scaffold15.g4223.t1
MDAKYARQLQDILLSWDYWELSRELDEGRGPIAELPTIPPRFSSAHEYITTFEPLLLEECAAQVLRGQEEGHVAAAQPGVVGAAAAAPDGGVAVQLALPAGVAGGFSENDILLLSRDNPEDEEGDELTHALAFVEGHEGDQSLRLRLRLCEDSQAGSARGVARMRAVRAALAQDASRWWALRLCNTSTVLREWAAVHAVAHLPLREVLLSAKSLVAQGRLEVPPRMRRAMEGAYNASQMVAVTSGLDGAQVMLVQGPPGTGKTKTILGLLSIVMHSAPKGAFAAHIAPSAPPGGGAANGVAAGGGGARAARPSFDARRTAWWVETPWLAGAPDPRAAVVPAEAADPREAFGLLHRGIARRIGRREGPKARVLESTPEGSSSLVNKAEAEVVLTAYRELTHRHAELRGRPAVGVISPYKAQVSLLRQAFRDGLGDDATRMVDINSIDGFQGREKEVAIFSTVRSGRHGRSIGFVADERRINVGLTRARKSLLIVGNAAALKGDPHWGALISHARRRGGAPSGAMVQGCMYRAQKPYADWLSRLADGLVEPEAARPEDGAEPQPEPGLHDDADFSEDELTIVQAAKRSRGRAGGGGGGPAKRAKR